MHPPATTEPDAFDRSDLEMPRRAQWISSRSRLGRHPMLLDCLLVLVLDAWVLPSMYFHGTDRGWWPVLFSQLLVLPLVLRRRKPWQVFLFIAALAAVQWLTNVRLTADIALLVALYSVAAHCSRRRAQIAAGIVEAGVVLASIRFAPTGDGVLASIVLLSGLVAAALFGGITLRTRRHYLAALTERATRLERERDQLARLAATAERTRIARELHDVIAHSLSVIITLADGAALAYDSDPDQSREAMRQVAHTGRTSMTEMRRLLGVLRTDDDTAAELAPQPKLERLDSLISEVRATGLPVELTVSGTPHQLTATAESALYRIVQESLTNVLKHADHPTRVGVAIRWTSTGVELAVTDDGKAARPLTSAGLFHGPNAPAGHGVIGMRERAGLFRGTVHAGPSPYGGWQVLAQLPADTEG